MNRRIAAAAAALLLAGCASRPPPPPGAFAFGVMGDTPYNAREEVHFVEMIRQAGGEDLAFVVHVGDFKGAGSPCTDALFERRHAEFDASRHPLFFVPGDNEWTDCRRPENGGSDALERLARLRQVFFAHPASLGIRRLPARTQHGCLAPAVEGCRCGAHPENRAWNHGLATFVSLHVVGSENNTGFDRANDAEARCRNEANRRWLDQGVDQALADGARALVVIIQANPWNSLHAAYDGFLAQLERGARRFQGPVLLVHGDTHSYRVDYPIAGVTRLETYGSPMVGWVRVTVAPGDAMPFRFESRLVAIVPRAL